MGAWPSRAHASGLKSDEGNPAHRCDKLAAFFADSRHRRGQRFVRLRQALAHVGRAVQRAAHLLPGGGMGRDKGKMADPYGCWWLDEASLHTIFAKIERLDMFEGWMPADVLSRAKSLPLHYRALTAVCEDWNDLREQVVLTLPHGQELTGLCGRIASQPLRSSLSRSSPKTPWLPGELEQVFFKRAIRREERNINPLWVHWVQLW